MLKIKLIHPDILMALGSSGHGANVLIADGHFPISTCVPPACKKVFLNLSPGLLTVTDILGIITGHIEVERATVIVPPDERVLPIHNEFMQMLEPNVPVEYKKRIDFYQEVRSDNTCLAIASGDVRRFANILLTIGCHLPV